MRKLLLWKDNTVCQAKKTKTKLSSDSKFWVLPISVLCFAGSCEAVGGSSGEILGKNGMLWFYFERGEENPIEEKGHPGQKARLWGPQATARKRYPSHLLRLTLPPCWAPLPVHSSVWATLWCLPGSYVHESLQAAILEWVAMPSSRRSSWPTDWTCVSWSPALASGFLTASVTWEARGFLWAVANLGIPLCQFSNPPLSIGKSLPALKTNNINLPLPNGH